MADNNLKKQNVTISISSETVRKARILAAQDGSLEARLHDFAL